MALSVALGGGIRRILGRDLRHGHRMKVYDRAGLQQLLGIGRDRAYRIMRDYGFRVGDRAVRISEPQIKQYIRNREMTTWKTEKAESGES